jgi:uncharacterized phage protein (TIGR01671 family)
MMRVIKFRGKRLIDSRWVYGYFVDAYDAPMIIYENYEGFYHKSKVDPETVGQYTGLKDKNGQEIYEGDILRDEFGRISQVYWVDKEARFTIRDHNRKTEYFMLIDHLNVEVIDNIYDNPEVLGANEQ